MHVTKKKNHFKNKNCTTHLIMLLEKFCRQKAQKINKIKNHKNKKISPL